MTSTILTRQKQNKAIVEIPQFFIEEFTEFYPNAKFMLVERDVNAWERSVNNTIVDVFNACRSFPMNITQYFDPYIKGFVGVHDAFEQVMFHKKGLIEGMEDAKRDSILEYVHLLLLRLVYIHFRRS